MFTLLARLRSDEHGTALIEGAIVLPVLMLLAYGVFEFSNAFYAHHLMTTGIRDAARYLARTADPAAAASQARNLATTGTIDGSGRRRVSWWAPSDVAVAVQTIANPVDPATGERPYRGGNQISIVTVSTSPSYPGLGTLGFLGLSSFAVRASHRERVIGD
ncbi:pilus assembly protein [Chelatococcus sp. SYSU_G07232]|uniref:Pilus assembly protein n=1 Tax=Chelatococcus albus TaxID=3047466 RepID=A0ABT7AIK0_9HYPH|nr:TadE family protein [Chelatococcus sp. SYSU_G07232]MDJ1159215.1 pilus assembly protein [Chelatococcus sp. SYSU_G07232]